MIAGVPNCRLIEFINEYAIRRTMDIPINTLSTDYLKQDFLKRNALDCGLIIGCVIDDTKCNNESIIPSIIIPCDCPIVVNATEDVIGPSYYANVYFDMSIGFSCSFQINFKTNYTTAIVTINSLTDFTSNIGNIYCKRVLVGGYQDIYYWITKLDGTFCTNPILISFACDAPTIQNMTFNGYSLGVSPLSIVYGNCGSTCHTMTFVYLQISPIVTVPDSGNFTDIIDCILLPQTFFHYLTPIGVTLLDTITYQLSYTDCCNNNITQVVSFTQPCVGPKLGTVNGHRFALLFIGSPITSWKLGGVNVAVLGIDCNAYSFTYTQTNVLMSGVADTGTITINPAIISLPTYDINPNINFVGYTGIVNPTIATTFPTYDIVYIDCCGNTFTQIGVTYFT